MKLQAYISRVHNEAFRGKIVDVLIEATDKRSPLIIMGRTRTNRMVICAGDERLIGKNIRVKIDAVKSNSLEGEGFHEKSNAGCAMQGEACGVTCNYRSLRGRTVVVMASPARAETGSMSMAQVEQQFLAGRFDQALESARVLIDSRSGNREEAYYYKGQSELKLGKYADARQSFNTIIERYPGSRRGFDALIGIGDTYLLEGNTEQALKAYNGALYKSEGVITRPRAVPSRQVLPQDGASR